MYFNGPTIYSYGDHFPMARILDDAKNGSLIVLENDDKYSVTTSKHQWCVRRAINARFRHDVFAVSTRTLRDWGWKESPRSLFYADYERRLKDYLDAAAKPRIRHRTRNEAMARANTVIEEANRFALIYGDAVPFPTDEAQALASAFHDSLTK